MSPVVQKLLIENTVSRERLSCDVCDTFNQTGRILKGTGMRVLKQLMAILIVVLMALGCNNGGSRSAAGKACDDFCDGTSEECETFDSRNCEVACDQLDKLDDDLSRRCEEAIVDLFNCLDNSTCDDLNATFTLPIENLGNFFDQLEGLCQAQEQDVKDQCAGDFVIIDAIEP